MQLKVILAGIILLHACFNSAISQSDEIRFSKVNGENGEPLGKITAITQDAKGYMWFAGEGEKCIYRYDGTRLLTFRQDIMDSNSLGSVNPFVISSDSPGNVWIGFHDTGLDQLNPQTGVFRHYRHDPSDPSSLGSDDVTVLLTDHQGILWIGTANGLDRFDEKTGKFIHYRHDPENPKSLSNNYVWAIYEDRQGVIWVGTGFPWFKMDPEGGGLNRLEADGSFTRFMHDPKNPHSLISNKVRSIFEDSRGVFWVGTSGDGLHTMDRKTGRVERHRYDPSRPDKLSRPPLKTDDWFNYNDQVTFITEDRVGFIWIGSMWSGLNRYDPTTNKIKHFEGNFGFSDSSGWSTYQSRDGVMWVSTQEDNLFRIDFLQNRINDVELGTSVHRFLEDKNGHLWLGTESGLLQLNQQRKLLHHFLLDSSNAGSSLNNITSLFQNQEDTIWIGTHNGFGIFDKRTKTFTRFNVGSNFKEGDLGLVITIIQDHLGLMWFTTEKGLMQYNPRDGFIKWYRKDEKDGSIRSNRTIVVTEDRSGSIWVGTGDGGVNRLNRETDTFKQYLGTAKESSMFIDAKGKIYAGTPNGLYQYNESEDNFSALGYGSVINRDRTFGITEDDDKNLWVITPSAITRVNAERNESFTYGSQIGIKNLAPGALYQAGNGEMLVGHANGFYTFFPEALGKNTQPLEILITDVLVNNLPLERNDGRDSTKLNTIEDVNKLELKYSQNNLIFKYASTDYRAPEATKYFTKLEAYDDMWREASADRATYFF